MAALRTAAALVVALAVAIVGAGAGHATSDPDALWRIVDTQCVPDQLAHGDPAPCVMVDLGNDGSAVLKDLVGHNQFLLIPTARLTGIESPAMLAPGAPNYFADAWRAKVFVDERAGWTLPRDWVSLAINSVLARSQNQLHIHVDCVRADVRERVERARRRRRAAVGSVPGAARRAPVRRDRGRRRRSGRRQPVRAAGRRGPGARDDMGSRTLVVVGATGADGRPGFVVLSDHADAASGDLAEGEELQDHAFCPAPPALATQPRPAASWPVDPLQDWCSGAAVGRGRSAT